jgi:hypothetical protein
MPQALCWAIGHDYANHDPQSACCGATGLERRHLLVGSTQEAAQPWRPTPTNTKADADIAAARLVDWAKAKAWIDSTGTRQELPVPYPGR